MRLLERHICGREAGQVPAGVDAQAEATGLLAMSAGLGTSVLAGQRSVEDTLDVLRYHLDRLLRPYWSPTGWLGASPDGPADLSAERS